MARYAGHSRRSRLSLLTVTTSKSITYTRMLNRSLYEEWVSFMNWLARIQRALLIVGSVLIAIYIAAYIHRTILSKAQVRRFEVDRRQEPDLHGSKAWSPQTLYPVDFSLWAEKRVAAYRDSLIRDVDGPLAVLRIRKLRLEVPVLEGTDDLTLNRAVGHIGGTSLPGQDGNVGIAGHRDGFFRVLKDISAGDTIDLLTPEGDERFVVDRIVLVSPNDVSVLQPRSGPSLTLVTCYPFYFIGSAPQRYIVQATKLNSHETGMKYAQQSGLKISEP